MSLKLKQFMNGDGPMSAVDTNRMSFRASRNGLFGKMIDAVVAWNEARITRSALSRLSDRELNDIGLTRYDIDRVAR